MNDFLDFFWQASLDEIKNGFIYQEDSGEFICLICGQRFSKGIIYPHDDILYEAEKNIKVHIKKQHDSPFHYLINLDKKLTGLTDHQKAILELFYQGLSDKEVAKELNITSQSTVRNHRFTLKEKQKQAKVFLAIMELLGEQIPKKDTFIPIPRNAEKVDARFAITEQENEKILAKYFKEGLNGSLELFPLKEKNRVVILRHLLKHFDANKKYTEKEINIILKKFYGDYALLRRCLIEYGFMDRNPDGSSYWVKI